ncbi:IniB N-terminal domain-containing protein [Pseudonocardia xinjiangensis]|uniref:IniB N-terminal domain-containing protein n=1 Tax=Pseudonocardia xinjiangensis TaxID=75289 RepID=UPI003D911746
MTEMTTSTSLLDLLLNLLRDPEALAAYKDDPESFLASCGDISPDDVRDALVLLEDSQDADFDREHNSGGNGGHHNVHVPPPHTPDRHDGESDHDATVRYLNTYITNNHIDDRDTIVDNSVNQQIDTGGGDFDQDIDIDSAVASGDGAVAAGGDIEDSTIVTGDDNQVGDNNVNGEHNVVGDDNNVISGDDNTAAFGDGDANSTSFEDVSVNNGGAIAVGGDADGSSDVDGSFNDTTTETHTSTEYDDSFNEDNDTTSGSFNDSHSSTDVDSHDTTHNDVDSHNDLTVDH